MANFPFSIIGFDLDGTLVDSHLDLGPAVNHALGRAGRPPVSLDTVRELVGAGTAKMLERALERTGGPLPIDEFELLLGDLLAYYETNIADATVPYPGCLDALDALAARGCTLAVCTNKMQRFAQKLLDELGMSDRFACVLGGDTMGPGRAKPAPDMIEEAIRRCGDGGGADARFVMIGDSSYDVRAAKAAGVPVVAVSFGYHDMPVDQLGADAVIDSYAELIPALERLG